MDILRKTLVGSLPVLVGGGIFATSSFQDQISLGGVTFPPPIAGLLSGFFATVVMILVMMLLQVVAKIPLSIPLILGKMFMPRSSESDQRTLGTTLHLALGSFWGFVFAMLIQYSLAPDHLSIFANGIFFGVLLWLLLMVVITPLLGHGLFGLKAGRFVALFTLIGHLSYGIFLGFIFPLILLE